MASFFTTIHNKSKKKKKVIKRKKNGLKKPKTDNNNNKWFEQKDEKKSNEKRGRESQNERRWQKSRKERWKGVIFVHNTRKILFLVFSPNRRDWFLVGIRRKYMSSTKIFPIFNHNQTTQKTLFCSYVLSSLCSLQPNGLKKMHVTNLY